MNIKRNYKKIIKGIATQEFRTRRKLNINYKKRSPFQIDYKTLYYKMLQLDVYTRDGVFLFWGEDELVYDKNFVYGYAKEKDYELTHARLFDDFMNNGENINLLYRRNTTPYEGDKIAFGHLYLNELNNKLHLFFILDSGDTEYSKDESLIRCKRIKEYIESEDLKVIFVEYTNYWDYRVRKKNLKLIDI